MSDRRLSALFASLIVTCLLGLPGCTSTHQERPESITGRARTGKTTRQCFVSHGKGSQWGHVVHESEDD